MSNFEDLFFSLLNSQESNDILKVKKLVFKNVFPDTCLIELNTWAYMVEFWRPIFFILKMLKSPINVFSVTILIDLNTETYNSYILVYWSNFEDLLFLSSFFGGWGL